MSRKKRYILLAILLLGLGFFTFWYFYCTPILPAGHGPYPRAIQEIWKFFLLITGLILIEISSIALVNSIITRENILKNYTRARIFTLIKTNPGVHFNEIAKNLGIGKGQTHWHLTYLERFDLIIRKKQIILYHFIQIRV
ncbi:MAG: hypothetical protein FK733_09290 [Asgard group archaeon]|nr:hypothetical protein [Asgard group archaeon]